MSDILIRGMEMPKHCGECPFKFGYWFDDFYICAARHGEKLHINVNTGFDDRCPLGNVPPHGRLIDADALMDQDGDVWDGVWGYSGVQIANAPTVIPASE